MIEVFKTNVTSNHQAKKLAVLIEEHFSDYQVNFDLQDCDRILRVETQHDPVDSFSLINLLKDLGVSIEVLSDEVELMSHLLIPIPPFYCGPGLATMLAMSSRPDEEIR